MAFRFLLLLCVFCGLEAPSAESGPRKFRIATYNLENYLDAPSAGRPAKSTASKLKIRESILAFKPDVLALQEVGTTNGLLQLQADLKGSGLNFPHWEFVQGFDTNIHLAILSAFPFRGRKPHTRESFLLSGRRFSVSRGFAEVEIEVSPDYHFTLITAHLKSRRTSTAADEAEMREQEATILRDLISTRLEAKPELNLVVLGDFNDVKDARSTRTVLGRGKLGLIDIRPSERNGDRISSPEHGRDPRTVTWTHYYGREDTYSRIDYIFLSRGMAAEWEPTESFVFSAPDWGLASDHRPVVATFVVPDRSPRKSKGLPGSGEKRE